MAIKVFELEFRLSGSDVWPLYWNNVRIICVKMRQWNKIG